MITVYYDGKCGMCANEINYYRKIAGNGLFAWRDITVDDADFLAKGYRLTEGLRALHAEENDGTMHKGADAFILIWRHLPGWWRGLSVFTNLPIIRSIARGLYQAFAAWRFKQLAHCQIAEQNDADAAQHPPAAPQ